MGVTGLWGILEPTGKPVRIQSLRGKVLSVDVSIWLHQSVKGFRDKDGNPIRNSHLLGVFHRVCKLLSHGIKPIFVFDGGVPVLKRQTLALRRQRKIEAQDKSLASRKKLIQNLLKQQLQRQYLTDLPPSEEIDAEIDRVVKAGAKISNTSQNPTTSKSTKDKSSPQKPKIKNEFEDDFEKFREKLAENFNNFSLFFSDLDAQDDSDDSEFEGHADDIKSYDDNFDAILKPSFDELPLEIQHEMLFEMTESRKNNSWGKMDQMPKDLKDFSSFQMERLRKRRTLQKKIQTVQKEMGQRHIHLSNFDDLAAMEYDDIPTATTKSILSSKEKGLVYVRNSSSPNQPLPGPSGNKQKEERVITTDDFMIGNSSSDEESSGKLTEEQQLQKALQLSLQDVREELPDKVKLVSNSPGVNRKVSSSAKIFTEESSKLTEDQELERALQLSLQDIHKGPPDKTKVMEDSSKVDREVLNAAKVFADVLNSTKDNNISDELNKTASKNHFKDIVSTCGPKEDISRIENLIKEVQSLPAEKKRNDVIQVSDSSCSDFEDVEVEDELEPKPKADVPEWIKTSSSGVNDTLTIAFSTNENFKEEEDIFADVFNANSSTTDVLQKQSPGNNSGVSTGNLANDFIKISKSEEAPKNEPEVFLDSDSDFENVEMLETAQVPETVTEKNEDGPTIARTLGIDPAKSVRMISAQYMQAQQRLNKEQGELMSSKGFQERVATSITDQMYSEAQELLTLFGVPYIISPMEAESQCAFLDTACLTEGTITDDSDVWLFGGQRVYKNFFSQGDRQLELYEYANVVQNLSMDREKLVLIAILTGSDYTDGVESVGPVKALEILSEFPSNTISAFDSLVRFREWWDKAQENKHLDQKNKIRTKFRKLNIRPGFPSQAVYDAYMNPTIDESLEPFRWGTADLDALRTYTKEKFGWNQQKCDAALLPLIKSLRCQAEETTRQLTMDSFIKFGERKGVAKRKKIKSKRLEQAMKKLKGPTPTEVHLSTDSESETEKNVPGPTSVPSNGLSESDDEELDALLIKMGVKRLKVNRNAINSAGRAASNNLTRGRSSVGRTRPVPSPSSSSSNSSPVIARREIPATGNVLVTPTKKPEIITQKAREEFQKTMNKKKAIEILKKRQS